MKTTNNVQKTILKSFAGLVSFVLITFTVSAQDFWHTIMENETFSEIALAMTSNTSTEVSDAHVFLAILETEKEAPLEMEEWMTSENTFGTFFTIETEVEPANDLENWMMEERNFAAPYFIIETEKTMELEDWMLKEENFNSTFEAEQEQQLQMESWMVENNYWERG